MPNNHVIRQQYCSDGDARISHIECWPVIITGMDNDEIDHIAKSSAVGQVADDSSQE
jgi:hypothetical protein